VVALDEEEKLKAKVIERLKLEGKEVLQEVRIPFGQRKVDIVAVGEKISVIECKAGGILRPSHGLGQLLFYKGVIEANYEDFISIVKYETRRKKIPSFVEFRLYLRKAKTLKEKEARKILRSQLVPNVSIIEMEDC